MANYLRRRFQFLLPGIVHTFKIKAWAGLASSEWSDPYDLRTSQYDPIQWNRSGTSYDWLDAVAQFWAKFIKVTWRPISNIYNSPVAGYPLRFDHYILMRKEGSVPTTDELNHADETNPYCIADTGRRPFYLDFDISPEKTYYYWVRAIDKKGMPSSNYAGYNNAEWGNPEQPTITSCSTNVSEVWPSVCDVTVNFTCVGGAEYYVVKRRLQGLSHWAWAMRYEHDASLGDNQTVTLNNFLTDSTYEFQVTAVNAMGILKSEPSDTYTYETAHDETAPGNPSWISADIPKRQNYVVLTWGLPTNWARHEITGYNIYRLKDGNPVDTSSYTLIKSVGNVLFYKDDISTGDANYKSHKYHYRVTATDKYYGSCTAHDHESDITSSTSRYDTASFTTPDPVSVYEIDQAVVFNFWNIVKMTHITLAWNDVSEADWYTVQWRWKYKGFDGTWGAYTGWSAGHKVDETEVDDYGKLYYTTTVSGNGIVQFKITSENTKGGKATACTTTETIVGIDKTAPSQTGTITVDVNKNWLGAWFSIEISWDTPNWTEGVKLYKIYKRLNTESGSKSYWHVVPNRYGEKTRFIDLYPARGDGNVTSVTYTVTPIDYMNNQGYGRQIVIQRPTV